MALVLGVGGNAFASDAMLMEQTIDVQTGLDLANFPTKTLYRSKKDANQFYYLPANLRFALDKEGRPMLTVYKYNLVYNNKNQQFMEDSEVKTSEVYQGGTLKATFTMGLRENELDILEQAVIAKGLSSQPKIGRLPISSAEFSVTLTDPENEDGAKVLLGPFPAPVSADIIAVQEPLSRSATDIFYTILTKKSTDGKPVAVPDAPINVLLDFTYEGYGLDGMVTVAGNWDNLYKATETKMEAKANYWFVSASASYEDKRSELVQDADIKITYDGDVPPELAEDVENRVMDKILEQAFDLGGLSPAPEDSLDPAAGSATSPDGQTLFGKPVGGSVGFARKAVSRQKKGNIQFTKAILNRLTVEDARYAVLDIGEVDPERNVLVVEPSDWSVALVEADLAADVEPFLVGKKDGEPIAQRIAITYGTDVSKQTFPESVVPGGETVSFGNFPTGGSPIVDLVWTLPFAETGQLAEDLGVEESAIRNSWKTTTDGLKAYYGSPAVYERSGDLRLMSGISLSASSLPVVPQLYTITLEGLAPEEADVDRRGNMAKFEIEQVIQLPGGKTKTLKYTGPMAKFEGDTYYAMDEPWQLVMLSGEGVLSTKLYVSNSGTGFYIDGKRKSLKARTAIPDDEYQVVSGDFIFFDLSTVELK